MDVPLHDRLDGQTALVTGANRGIGARLALGLADLGATVYAGTREPDALEGIEAESQGRIRRVVLDVAEERACAAAVATAVRATGRLDLLVNNAGVGDFHGTTLETLDAARFDHVLRVNLRGPVLLAREALPHLLERPGGRVVNIGSGMGALEGMGGTAPAYRISKAGLNALTAYLHGEYGPRGLLANSACPGWVRTRMGGSDAPRSPERGAETPLWLCRFRPGAPAGRFWRDRQPIPW